MKKTRFSGGFLFTCILVFVWACSSSGDWMEEPQQPEIPPQKTDPDSYHDKYRTKPYPKEDNELLINPSPLIVPQAMKTSDLLQFCVSRDEDFSGSATITSRPVPWCMYNLHQALDTGLWYWRFRSVSHAGAYSDWSDTYRFEVKAQTPRFVTPEFSAFAENIPRRHPRLYCFLDEGIDAARAVAAQHAEYKQLTARAALALAADYAADPDPAGKADEIKNYMLYLYQAYHLTQQETYRDKIVELLRRLLDVPIPDSQLFASNFGATDIAIMFILAYDIAYERLTSGEKSATEALILRVVRYYYTRNRTEQENHIFDNHFWQHNFRVLLQGSFVLSDKEAHADEMKEMLEYYYELWTARAPAGGFNLSGAWINGQGYFSTNVHTLYYVPSLFSGVTGFDFLTHPWYRNAGQAMLYSWPLNSKSVGFGDGSESGDQPVRSRLAFADFIAREVGDPYAGWYATQGYSTMASDYEFRLYRMVRGGSYWSSELPAACPKYVWYRDVGEVSMHSDLADTENNMALSFRSSAFGSGSHTLADQNAFNLLYKGTDVYRSSGYYLNFSDAHNMMSYRHTRAHNTILVNGIGQPFSTKGYGVVTRAGGGEHITYALGDASHAYSGVSEDPMWIENFRQAGISQTPENGFGKTPLTLYKRHVFMLHPDKIVLYDELEAAEPVQWSWLLHSPVRFTVEQNKLSTHYPAKNFSAVTQLFSHHQFTITQTDRFVVAPDLSLGKPGVEYPNQWHMTASFPSVPKTRILTIVQIVPDGKQIQRINSVGNTLTCGEWEIVAQMDPDKQASIDIINATRDVLFSYGAVNPTINGSIYPRTAGSSLLYDVIDGTRGVNELYDYTPASSRAAIY